MHTRPIQPMLLPSMLLIPSESSRRSRNPESSAFISLPLSTQSLSELRIHLTTTCTSARSWLAHRRNNSRVERLRRLLSHMATAGSVASATVQTSLPLPQDVLSADTIHVNTVGRTRTFIVYQAIPLLSIRPLLLLPSTDTASGFDACEGRSID